MARSYGGGVTILAGSEATGAGVLSALRNHDVAHIAAHAVVDVREPFRSSLVLAPESGGTDGDLSVADLLGVDLSRCRVVVLAACESSGGVISRSEGPLGLAWTFLADGVPEVVATLWEIDDATSVRLFGRLHEDLAAGVPVSAARGVQRAAIADGVRLRDWAGIAVYQ